MNTSVDTSKKTSILLKSQWSQWVFRITFGFINHFISISCREKRLDDGDYIKIFGNKGGCYSLVGKSEWGGEQVMSLDVSGCLSEGTIIHEFIHAIGFYHEQNRPDRDDYVEIQYQNLQKGQSVQYQFQKQVNSLTFGVPYDGKSIMHYRWWEFAANPNDLTRPAIKSKVILLCRVCNTSNGVLVAQW